MPATVSAPPPPEFEMKGNDFPALPGMSIIIMLNLTMTVKKVMRIR